MKNLLIAGLAIALLFQSDLRAVAVGVVQTVAVRVCPKPIQVTNYRQIVPEEKRKEWLEEER